MIRPPHTHHAPTSCPVCGEPVHVTRITCQHCETELSGRFQPCEFCGLTDDDRDLLREFLASRGNIKHLSRHLDVSYPTARTRLDEVLVGLGFVAADDVDPGDMRRDLRLDALEALARGEMDIDEAATVIDGGDA